MLVLLKVLYCHAPHFIFITLYVANDSMDYSSWETRMHSSRKRTAHSSSCQGELASSPSTSPLGVGLDQIHLNFPLGVGLDQICLKFPFGCMLGPDPPQLPPWVWVWTRSPSTSPLGCGPGDPLGPGTPPETRHPLGQAPRDKAPPPPGTRHPPGPGTLQDQAPPWTRHPSWTETLTHATQNITLPQTSFAGGNETY